MKQPALQKQKCETYLQTNKITWSEKQGSAWWTSFCCRNKTDLGKQAFQGACLLEWYSLLKHCIWGCVQFALCVCWMDSIKAHSCPFESSLEQSYTRQLEPGKPEKWGRFSFCGTSFLLDLSATWALRQVPVVLYVWTDQSDDAWKTIVVSSIL